jgi:hypothetical protein
MPGDNFVERVHAYSKWLLDIEDSTGSDSATPLNMSQAGRSHQVQISSETVGSTWQYFQYARLLQALQLTLAQAEQRYQFRVIRSSI